MGIGEKYFSPIDNSGFFNIPAIMPEKENKKTEKASPQKNRTLVIFRTISFPCDKLYRGK